MADPWEQPIADLKKDLDADPGGIKARVTKLENSKAQLLWLWGILGVVIVAFFGVTIAQIPGKIRAAVDARVREVVPTEVNKAVPPEVDKKVGPAVISSITDSQTRAGIAAHQAEVDAAALRTMAGQWRWHRYNATCSWGIPVEAHFRIVGDGIEIAASVPITPSLNTSQKSPNFLLSLPEGCVPDVAKFANSTHVVGQACINNPNGRTYAAFSSLREADGRWQVEVHRLTRWVHDGHPDVPDVAGTTPQHGWELVNQILDDALVPFDFGGGAFNLPKPSPELVMTLELKASFPLTDAALAHLNTMPER